MIIRSNISKGGFAGDFLEIFTYFIQGKDTRSDAIKTENYMFIVTAGVSEALAARGADEYDVASGRKIPGVFNQYYSKICGDCNKLYNMFIHTSSFHDG